MGDLTTVCFVRWLMEDREILASSAVDRYLQILTRHTDVCLQTSPQECKMSASTSICLCVVCERDSLSY